MTATFFVFASSTTKTWQHELDSNILFLSKLKRWDIAWDIDVRAHWKIPGQEKYFGIRNK